MTTTPQEALRAAKQALEDAEAGLTMSGAEQLKQVGDFVPTPLLALRSVRKAIAALSQQAAQEPTGFHDWAMRAIGTVMLKDGAAAEALAAELRALYAAAPAKPAEPDGYMAFNSAGEAHGYSPKSKPIKGLAWEPVYRATPAEQEKAHTIDELTAAFIADDPYFADELAEARRELADSQQAPSTAAQERDAIADIAAERQRQKSVEGWTPEHDDKYHGEELRLAALCYMRAETITQTGVVPASWPWPAHWWKPTNDRRNLVKAGALIAAEIDRMDRAALAHKGAQGDKHE